MDLNRLIHSHAHQVMPHQVIAGWLKDYKRPNDKIKALGDKGLLQTIKKGLYIAGPSFGVTPDPFLVANHILGPSYVSMDTALSYYGFIPERVYEITSMTTKAPRKFDTPMGHFAYISLPLPYYAFGITACRLPDNQWALLASPEKAICDKIVATRGLVFRSIKGCQAYLTDALRVEEYTLKSLDTAVMTSWLPDAPKRESLTILIKMIRTL